MTLQVGTPTVTLNPLAAEFVPFFLQRSGRKYTGWGRDGFETRKGEMGCAICLHLAEPSYNILDAPDEVNPICMSTPREREQIVSEI